MNTSKHYDTSKLCPALFVFGYNPPSPLAPPLCAACFSSNTVALLLLLLLHIALIIIIILIIGSNSSSSIGALIVVVPICFQSLICSSIYLYFKLQFRAIKLFLSILLHPSCMSSDCLCSLRHAHSSSCHGTLHRGTMHSLQPHCVFISLDFALTFGTNPPLSPMPPEQSSWVEKLHDVMWDLHAAYHKPILSP